MRECDHQPERARGDSEISPKLVSASAHLQFATQMCRTIRHNALNKDACGLRIGRILNLATHYTNAKRFLARFIQSHHVNVLCRTIKSKVKSVQQRKRNYEDYHIMLGGFQH